MRKCFSGLRNVYMWQLCIYKMYVFCFLLEFFYATARWTTTKQFSLYMYIWKFPSGILHSALVAATCLYLPSRTRAIWNVKSHLGQRWRRKTATITSAHATHTHTAHRHSAESFIYSNNNNNKKTKQTRYNNNRAYPPLWHFILF